MRDGLDYGAGGEVGEALCGGGYCDDDGVEDFDVLWCYFWDGGVGHDVK